MRRNFVQNLKTNLGLRFVYPREKYILYYFGDTPNLEIEIKENQLAIQITRNDMPNVEKIIHYETGREVYNYFEPRAFKKIRRYKLKMI